MGIRARPSSEPFREAGLLGRTAAGERGAASRDVAATPLSTDSHSYRAGFTGGPHLGTEPCARSADCRSPDLTTPLNSNWWCSRNYEGRRIGQCPRFRSRTAVKAPHLSAEADVTAESAIGRLVGVQKHRDRHRHRSAPCCIVVADVTLEADSPRRACPNLTQAQDELRETVDGLASYSPQKPAPHHELW